MATPQVLGELLDLLDQTERAVKESLAEFLRTFAVYDARGVQLEQAVIGRVRPYRDPANDRDVVIQQAARDIERGISNFLELRTRLVEKISILRLEFATDELSQVVEALKGLESPAAAVPETPIEVVRSFLDTLEKAQVRYVLLAAQAVAVRRNVLKAQVVATALIQLRQAESERYLREALSVDLDAVLDSAQDILTAEARDVFIEECLKAAAQVLGVTVETVFPVVRIATIVHDLHRSVVDLENRYKRTDVDSLLEFSRQVRSANEAATRDLELIDCVTDAIAAGRALPSLP